MGHPTGSEHDFFIFLFFYFCFLQKYIFDLEIYRNIPGRPAAGRPGPGRPAAGRGGRDFCAKTFAKIFARRSLAARLQGDRLSHPYIRVGWSPTPHLHH